MPHWPFEGDHEQHTQSSVLSWFSYMNFGTAPYHKYNQGCINLLSWGKYKLVPPTKPSFFQHIAFKGPGCQI